MRNTGHRFSDWMKYPTFTNTTGMMREINKLQPIELVTPLHPEGQPIKDRYAIRGKNTHDVYGFCTPKYKLVQDYQVAVPLYDAITNSGFEPIGRMYQRSDGKFFCDIKLEAPHFALEIGGSDKYDVGCRVYNGKDTAMGLGFKAMVIRYICTNGLIFATGFGSFKATHLGTPEQAIKKFAKSIDELTSGIARFEKMANEAAEFIVPSGVIRELMVGTGLELGTVDDIISKMPMLVPELMKDKVTAYTIHNSMTAYASHENRTEEGFEYLSRAANKLLVVEQYDDLIVDGREKIRIMTKK